MNLTLRVETPKEWAKVALSNFDAFLLDHASCERKASTVGMSFVVRYPDRKEILEPMINFAREELEHFHQVYKVIQSRGISLSNDEEDTYVNILMKAVRTGREERFLDRLVTSSVIEARGAERLYIIAEALTDVELKAFYLKLAKAEESHKGLFLKLAEIYFPKEVIEERLNFFLDLEAKAIQSVPFRAAVH